VLRRSDLAVVNYEGTFAPGGPSKCGSGSPNCFAFQAPARNARTLRQAGVDAVNLANNHAYDYGALGYASTRRALRRAGVNATGAPGEIRYMRRNRTRLALVGFSTYRWSAPLNDGGAVRRLVRRAARRADIVIVLFHAGAEGADRTHVPHGHEHAFGEDRGHLRAFARIAIGAGGDVVLGSGPHVLRGLELYRRRLIAYSLGNLTGWRNFNTSGGLLSLSALVTVSLSPTGRFRRGEIDSLWLDRIGVPHRDPSARAARLIRRLSHSDFRGRMRFVRLGTAHERRGRLER
jgi:poly-gamma-glutamate capsule biosynthesis protein CapA/YwtB (metallophosphatase superfamily)